MKSHLVILCIILTLVVMLPVIAQADAQSEFELLCGVKTSSACTVYDGTTMENVVASLSSGTYVMVGGEMPGGWKHLTFYQNGVRKNGWANVGTVACRSVVRSGGMAYDIHENDPEYDAKMKQGTVERDVREGWSIYGEDDPLESNFEHISPEEAAARAGQYTNSGVSNQRAAATGSVSEYATTGAVNGQPAEAPRAASAPAAVTFKAKLRRVSGKEDPEALLVAFVYAPNSGKASLREAADNGSKALAQCAAGTVVTVLEIGKTHSLVEADGQTGYLRNACLGYSAVKEEQVRLGALVGGGSINVRGGADKDSARIAQWPAGTQVTVYGVDGNWCEVEYEGQHGWVASKYVVAYQ